MATQEQKEKRHQYYLNRKKRGQFFPVPDEITSDKIKKIAENRQWSHSKTVSIILEEYIDEAYKKYMIK